MAYEVTMQGGYGRRDKHIAPDMEAAQSHIKEKMATGKYLGYNTKEHKHPCVGDHPLYKAAIETEE